MRAWRVHELGDPEQALKLDEIASIESFERRQVLVKTLVAGVCYADVLQCQGAYQSQPQPPFVAGLEALYGRVHEAGEESGFEKGQLVTAWPWLTSGSLAEFVLCDGSDVRMAPPNFDAVTAIALETSYLTAYLALRRGRARHGQTILVTAAAGALGMATVQLAASMGLSVFAAVGATEKRDICIELGAEYACSYRDGKLSNVVRDATGGQGVNLVLETVGGDVFDEAVRSLAHGGTCLVAGFSSGTIGSVKANRLLLNSLSVAGVYLGLELQHDAEGVAAMRDELIGLMSEHGIFARHHEMFPFEAAPQALTALKSRSTVGKVVLDLGVP